MISNTLKAKVSDTLRSLYQSMPDIHDYHEFPVILESAVKTLFHVDWMGIYTFTNSGNAYHIVTNPDLPFDWNEKYREIMPYDKVRVRSLESPVGNICIFSPKDYQGSDEDAFVYEVSKKYTDTSQVMAFHSAKTDSVDSGIAFYRADEDLEFTRTENEMMRYLSPFLLSLSHTMILCLEFDLKRAALEALCKSQKSLYFSLDNQLNMIDLPLETEVFLKRHFTRTPWKTIPEEILAWIRGVAAPQGTVALGTGPWIRGWRLPDMDLVIKAHAVAVKQQKIALVVWLRPHQRRHGFDLLLKDGLSSKEVEAISYLSLGYSNRQISLAMNIAEVTVKKHLKNASEKLGASGRTETLSNAIYRRTLRERMGE